MNKLSRVPFHLFLLCCVVLFGGATEREKYISQANESSNQQQCLERLRDSLELKRQEHHIPGMEIAIVKDGKMDHFPS